MHARVTRCRTAISSGHSTGGRTTRTDGKDQTSQNKEEPTMTSTRPNTATTRVRLRQRSGHHARCSGASRRSIVRGGHGEVSLGLTLGRSAGVNRRSGQPGKSLAKCERQPWSPRPRRHHAGAIPRALPCDLAGTAKSTPGWHVPTGSGSAQSHSETGWWRTVVGNSQHYRASASASHPASSATDLRPGLFGIEFRFST